MESREQEPALFEGDREIVLFGITPPRASTSPERVREIAEATLARLDSLPVDGLILYDLDDESDRNADERPFPYLRTLDPGAFLTEHLEGWHKPAVVYRCVGKYDEPELEKWLRGADAGLATVFVGASSGAKPVRTSLARAQELRREVRPGFPLGGVAIPERHAKHGDEHLRMRRKQEAGCSFFVTQVVYDVETAKNLASDYAYSCADDGVAPVPVVFTLSLCGSEKTLIFLEWLGVHVPRWVRNELQRAHDPLGMSLAHALGAARELMSFCRYLGLPFGFNIESVSNRRVEIDAAGHLARQVALELRHGR